MLEYFVFILYFSAAFLMLIYGLNNYVMITLFKHNIHKKPSLVGFDSEISDSFSKGFRKIPKVTTQIPIYNEYNVSERVIRAAMAMRYPKARHEVQILDDSNDETSILIDNIVKELKAQGHYINIIRRGERRGFKAGALANGMAKTESEYFAIFDADFIPPRDFLQKTIPLFVKNESIGLVQARWGHINSEKSLLTRAQSMGIDGHFMVEQAARCYGGLYMNFNGTAGVFRKEAIIAGGGWQWDTLTEDMDLSYRIQFAGWKTLFLPDLVVPAEIPEDIRAFKNQQFRWAKGSIQTAIKLFPEIKNSNVSLFKKVEAFFHLTHYIVHPLIMISAIFAMPLILIMEKRPAPVLFFIIAVLLVLAMSAPSSLYILSQQAAYHDWKKRIIYLPFLIIIGVGIAVSNTRAVIEALLGIKSDFIRTPKKGDREKKKYKPVFSGTALVEILLGTYCFFSFTIYLANERYLIGPFLFIYSAGFLYTGIITLFHGLKIIQNDKK
jgi:cellulose synthase/poly-beta-1,6-N-acetylglucosamine synthase-like glycosyltransferase